jgi:hypothetical protein
MSNHKILLFGGRGTGKTTLLASMADQSTRELLDKNLPLRIYPDDTSDLFLVEAVEELRFAFVEEPYETAFIRLEATDHPAEYRLNVGRERTSTPDLSIDFIDTPGELTQQMSVDLKQAFTESRAAILAIDTVELFHGERIHPKLRHNSPEKAYQLVDRWLQSVPNGTLLLCIAPLKNETWLRVRTGVDVEEEAKALLQKVVSEYEKMLKVLAQHDSRVAVIICPVQTVGNLIFDRYEPKADAYPGQLWKKVRGEKTQYQPPTGYAPLDCDQPLRHILNWLLIEEIDRRRQAKQTALSKFVEWALGEIDEELKQLYTEIRHTLLDIFGSDADLARAVSWFIAGAKTSMPFQIVQGKNLITRQSALWDFLSS